MLEDTCSLLLLEVPGASLLLCVVVSAEAPPLASTCETELSESATGTEAGAVSIGHQRFAVAAEKPMHKPPRITTAKSATCLV